MLYRSTRNVLSGVVAALLFSGSALMAQASPAASGPSSSQTAAPAKASDAKAPQNKETDPLKRPLDEKKKKENAKALKEELRGVYKKWVNEDVRYIITGEELSAFKQLSNDEERDNFIEQFWARRDPTPDTVENEYKEEHYRRIAYANEHFPAGIPGWKTDRGRIYIMWGKPDEIESHPSGGLYNREIAEGGGTTSTYPFEKWRYRYLEGVGQEVILEFVDSCMCNDYHLTMDPNEKDALLNVPGAGLTQMEEMGMSSKTDRLLGRYGVNPFGMNTGSKQFDNLELMAKVNTAPPVKFKDLEEVVSHKISYNLMPFDVRTDFVRVTGDTVLVPITIQIKNKDVTYNMKEGVQHGAVNIFGRVSTMTGRVAQTFEDTVVRDFSQAMFARDVEGMSVYWKALPLRPGRYRVDIVLKDVNGDRKGTWTRGIAVPEYPEDKLASSSLILADVMERVPKVNIGAGSFVIGDMKVRPRVESADGKPAAFKKAQKLNFWMQVYNVTVDEKTKRPNAVVEYEIVNAQTNKSLLKTTETTEQMGNIGDQLTLEKSMALASLDPGLYRLSIKVTDKVSGQTITPSARFMVEQ